MRTQGPVTVMVPSMARTGSRLKFPVLAPRARPRSIRYIVLPSQYTVFMFVLFQHLVGDVLAGHAVNNPSVKVSYPLDDSVQSQLARVDTALVTLQNLNGPGKGCPAVSTTLSAQQAALLKQL